MTIALGRSDAPPLRQAQPNHIPALDGLRGFAILLVLFRHLGYVSSGSHGTFGRVVSQAALNGILGVDLFFVLSGFLITGILFDSVQTKHYFRNFYMRRFLRIFPLYYGFLLALVLFSRWLHIGWAGMLPVYLSYTQNIIVGKVGNTLWGYTGQLWSLAVEEQFYLFWPFFVFLIRDRKQLMWTAGVLSVAALACRSILIHQGVSPVLVYRLTPCRMDELLAGAWIALAIRGGRMKILGYASPVLCLCSMLYILLQETELISNFFRFDLLDTVGPSVAAIGFSALLILTLDLASTASRGFRNTGLRWLGKYSYGIYIFHLTCLQFASKIMNNLPGLSRRLFIIHSTSATIAIGSFLATVILAWLSYNFYEIHFLKLKRYFSYNRPPRQPVIQSSTPTII